MSSDALADFFDHFPRLAVAALIAYSLVVTCFAGYKLLISIYSQAKKDHLTKLSSYCEHISDVVAQIAIAEAYHPELIEEFWRYYYGKLILVEDRALEGAMVELGTILKATTKENFAAQRETLQTGALQVSGACRDLIRKSWKLSIRPWSELQKSQADQERRTDENLKRG